MKRFINRLLPWGKSIALAYCHLPLVLLVGFTTDCPSWTWLAIVGLFPWMGMASPFLLVVIFGALTFLPGVWEGQPASWLTPEVNLAIVIGGTAAIFLPSYIFALRRAIDATRRRRLWRALLIVWTLFGNTFFVFTPPRALAGETTLFELKTVYHTPRQVWVGHHLNGIPSPLENDFTGGGGDSLTGIFVSSCLPANYSVSPYCRKT